MSYVNFPTDHPLSLGTQQAGCYLPVLAGGPRITSTYVREADVLFLIDIDVPWEPPHRNVLRDGVKIIHLDRDPMFTGIPGWGFPADLPLTGAHGGSLPVLTSIIRAKLAAGAVDQSTLDERRKKAAAEHAAVIGDMAATIEAARTSATDPSRLAVKVHR